MPKGSSFERAICKQLSLWWTDNKRTDVFWRTSGSGNRATARSKKGKKTFGQSADVQATDPIGQPLIDLCTIEIKKGYTRQTIFDLVDKLKNETKQPYKHFINQVIQDSEQAGSLFWMIIAKRDRKETLIIIPLSLYGGFVITGIKLKRATPSCKINFMHDNEDDSIKHIFWSQYPPMGF